MNLYNTIVKDKYGSLRESKREDPEERRLQLEDIRAVALPQQPCIFLSHESQDKEAVKRIGDYIQDEYDINIYLDANDPELQQAVNTGDDVLITVAIENGVAASSHLMVFISELTLDSPWVPFEFGFAKHAFAKYPDQRLSALILRDVSTYPSFLVIVEHISKKTQLDAYLTKINLAYPKKNSSYSSLVEKITKGLGRSEDLSRFLL